MENNWLKISSFIARDGEIVLGNLYREKLS